MPKLSIIIKTERNDVGKMPNILDNFYQGVVLPLLVISVEFKPHEPFMH